MKRLNLNTDKTLSENSNILASSQQAIKSYVDEKRIFIDFLQEDTPTTFSAGDKWLKPSTHKIYTATSNSTWNDGVDLQTEQIYSFDNLLYHWDGSNLLIYSTESVTEQRTGLEIKKWVGTQEQYDAIVTKDVNTEYIITDAYNDYDLILATQTEFNNSVTNKAATPYQVNQKFGNYLALAGGNLDAGAILRLTNTNNEVTPLAYNTSGYLTVGSKLYVDSETNTNSLVVRSGNIYKTNTSGDTVVWSNDLNAYLPLTGGTLSGNLSIPSNLLRTKQVRLAASDGSYHVDLNVYSNRIHLSSLSNIATIVRLKDGAYNDEVVWASSKATANGIASLDANGKVPVAQLPDNVYMEENLLPKSPVQFNKSVLSDYYTVVGSPTITDGVASGFSASNSIKTSQAFNPQSKSWELVCSFTYNGGAGLFGSSVGTDYQGIAIVFNSNKLRWCLSSNGNSWDIVGARIVGNTLTTGTKYKVKTAYDGSQYILSLAEGNGDFSIIDTQTSSTPIYVSSGGISFGDNYMGSHQTFNGSIDLNETYIKINGQYFVPPLGKTTVSVSSMTGADGVNAGTAGLVPAPAATDNIKFLRGDGTWATAGGGSADIDNSSITLNDSDEIQAVGLVEQRANTTIKEWVGTKAQYDSIATKDTNTIYNITDDVDSSISLLEALYPVGSIYISTNATCPLSALISGSSWVLVSSGRVLQGADLEHVAGTTIEAGLPNITGKQPHIAWKTSYVAVDGTGAFQASSATGETDGANTGDATNTSYLGFDASLSNPIYGNSNTVQPPAYVVNIFRRTA